MRPYSLTLSEISKKTKRKNDTLTHTYSRRHTATMLTNASVDGNRNRQNTKIGRVDFDIERTAIRKLNGFSIDLISRRDHGHKKRIRQYVAENDWI